MSTSSRLLRVFSEYCADDLGRYLVSRFMAGEREYGVGNIDNAWVDTAMEEFEELADVVIYRVSQLDNGGEVGIDDIKSALGSLIEFKHMHKSVEVPLRVAVYGEHSCDNEAVVSALWRRGHVGLNMSYFFNDGNARDLDRLGVDLVNNWADAGFSVDTCSSGYPIRVKEMFAGVGEKLVYEHILDVPFCWRVMEGKWRESVLVCGV